jgi:hypothetical protein
VTLVTAEDRTKAPARALSHRRLLGVALALGLLLALAACGDDDGDDVGDGAPTTVTTIVQQTTTAPPVTEPGGQAGELTPAEQATVVWPSVDGDLRSRDAVAAATGFADDYLGFTGPVVGEFRQGDSRSGEVPVRPTATGPETTVLVRQMSDDTWWVLGATTEAIEITEPLAGSAVDDPVQVAGRAWTFEGNVIVEVRSDGSLETLGQAPMTGGGDAMRPFEGSVTLDERPGQRWGAIVAYSVSAEDGRVWEATVVRVGFIGFD